MGMLREITYEYRWLLLALLVMATTSAVVTSCGGGGDSSSDGALCQQCGDSDGPCQDEACIDPSINNPAPCPTPITTRKLICRRKSDSAQQRCFPAIDEAGTDVDPNFRCDGSHPGATLQPPQVTPTPATPVPTATADASLCGNGTLDNLEQCDPRFPFALTCDDFCDGNLGGLLVCTDCRFDFRRCLGFACRFR